MKLHPDHIRAIEQLIPKQEQQAFVDRAIEEALQKVKKIPQKTSLKPDAGTLKVFADGGSRGNPGSSGGGFAVYRNGEVVLSGSEYFGEKTNNQAEYLALRLALRQVYDRFGNVSLECFMDSELVVKQMRGQYKVKSPNVAALHEEVKRIASQFKSFTISHVPRSQNQLADRLANEAMDKN